MNLQKKDALMIGVLLSGAFLTVLNLTLMTPALPTIMVEMSVDQTTVQWLTSAYSMTEAIVVPLAAFLMGRFSTRQLFIFGMALFTAGSLVAAFAPIFALVLLGRIMQAAATGYMMTMVFSVILLIFPPEKRGMGMGMVGLVIGVAPAIGPVLSGLLVDHMGWRMIFVIVSILAAAIIVLAAIALQNYDKIRKSKFDLLSVVLSSVGLFSLLYGISTFSSAKNHLITAAMIVAGIVVMGLYCKRQLTLDDPMLNIRILKTFRYRMAVIYVLIMQAICVGLETLMPLYIQGVLGHSATISGVTLLPGAILSAIAALVGGRLYDMMGARKPMLLASVVLIAGGYIMYILGVDSSVIWVGTAYAVFNVGYSLASNPINTWGINSLSNDDVPDSQSVQGTLNQVAAAFGVALLVSISAAASNAFIGSGAVASAAETTFYGYHIAFIVVAIVIIVEVLLTIVFVHDKKKDSKAAE
jgi:MFS transporter, DHA2 family, multidrug resistance protein